jgi:hypothetical protein
VRRAFRDAPEDGQRAALEEQLFEMPVLREAMRARVVSYEKARIIARFAPEAPDRWVSRAQRISCVDLRRELQAEDDRKMCARGSFRTFLPRRVHLLLEEACRAVRKATGQWFSPGECLGKMCARFMEIWRRPKGRKTRQKKIRDRDSGLCLAAAGRRRTCTTSSTAAEAAPTRSKIRCQSAPRTTARSTTDGSASGVTRLIV